MKKPYLKTALNGFEYRSKNKRVRVIQNDEEDYHFEFKHFIASNHLTSISKNERGIATTHIIISKETMMAICHGVLEREIKKGAE